MSLGTDFEDVYLILDCARDNVGGRAINKIPSALVK